MSGQTDAAASWSKNVEVRRQIRATVEKLFKEAEAAGDGSEMKLMEASARLKGKDTVRAQNAWGDLGLAAARCNDPKFRDRIVSVQRELEVVIS